MTDLLKDLEAVALLADRLDQLSDAVAKQQWNEFSMRVPAEPARDADLVLASVARFIRTHHAEIEAMARDAARYRWMRERVDWKPLPEDSAGKVYLVATMVSAVYGNTDDQTDAAIDAAMHDSARAKL